MLERSTARMTAGKWRAESKTEEKLLGIQRFFYAGGKSHKFRTTRSQQAGDNLRPDTSISWSARPSCCARTGQVAASRHKTLSVMLEW